MVVLKEGDRAPPFRLKDGDGRMRSSAEQEGFVLYFYPKDFTPDCTTQLEEFTDEYFYFRRNGFEIFGVSPDDSASHKKFCEMHQAPYPLLSDPDCEVARAYGAWKSGENNGAGVVRSTFVIRNGRIVQAHYRIRDVVGHAQELLHGLERERIAQLHADQT
ncbi:peroxiredoxin [Candidatus Micrarchaeota archaeon]|nr:peroxiredoxin [Candidatus Micrarchaeota archaeon]